MSKSIRIFLKKNILGISRNYTYIWLNTGPTFEKKHQGCLPGTRRIGTSGNLWPELSQGPVALGEEKRSLQGFGVDVENCGLII